MATWKELAAEVEDYIPVNEWEQLLRRHMDLHLPALSKELKADGDFEAYLKVSVDRAEAQMRLMIAQAMSPDDARQSAQADLLPTPPDEQNQTPAWETLGEVHGSLRGQINYLMRHCGGEATPTPPATKIPLK